MESEKHLFSLRQSIHYTSMPWQGKSLKQSRLMILLRKLFFIAARNNFRITVITRHILEIKNTIADAISRMHFQHIFSLAPQASKDPTPTPGILTTSKLRHTTRSLFSPQWQHLATRKTYGADSYLKISENL